MALVLADDLLGGWTDRYFTELAVRFEPAAELKRGWIVVTLWTGKEPSAEGVRNEVLAGVFRRFWYLRFGCAKTLAEKMRQEGLAAVFAGASGPTLDPEDLEYTREVLAEHREAIELPIVFACLYGDEAAKARGYRPLGLSERAGYALALAEAWESGVAPEATLLSSARG